MEKTLKFWFYFVQEKRASIFLYIWQEFKVFLEMLETEDIGFFPLLFWWSRAARRDLTYLEQLVYDFCSNGILIDTGMPATYWSLPTDEASNNKRKQGNTKLLFWGKWPYPSYSSNHYLHNSSPPSSFPAIAPFCSLRHQSQKYQPLINSN